ncbi:MAG: imidazolonepropionase [Chitinophagaceae bacterium]|nr:imidazolonepropionase [Chitinophagaceae bacterium]
MNVLIKNIKSLAGIRDVTVKQLRGNELKTLPSLDNAFLFIEEGKIAAFGLMEHLTQQPNGYDSSRTEEIDASGRLVLPCFCDSHTHLVFADTRENEFIYKIQGLSYEAIAAKGGGILNSAFKLRDTPEEILLEKALQRIEEIKNSGTGAVEIKSGYGLSYDGELKMLRVIKQLKSLSPIPVKATFLGAHAIPIEFKNNREGYLQLLIEQLLPKIAGEGLADYCDVFCDKGFFTPEETDRVLQAGWKYGLKPKIHANQLAISGGVQAGVRNNAISVDHLESMGDEEIECLIHSDTIPTMLPSAAFFLRMPYPPARQMIEAGLPVTLATDFNPGSSPSGRMSFVISLACIQMKMTPEEAINASTINGAAAMELSEILGSITIGKKANLIITKPINSIANIPYSFGSDVIDRVIIS